MIEMSHTLGSGEDEWANRWLGGFCPIGVLNGLPIRGDGAVPSPSLRESLLLPVGEGSAAADYSQAVRSWSQIFAASDVWLVASVERARELLLRASPICPSDHVGVPANATRSLVESLKVYGALPTFLEIGSDLQPDTGKGQADRCRMVWSQPTEGFHQ